MFTQYANVFILGYCSLTESPPHGLSFAGFGLANCLMQPENRPMKPSRISSQLLVSLFVAVLV